MLLKRQQYNLHKQAPLREKHIAPIMNNCAQECANNKAIHLKNIIISKQLGNPNHIKGCNESEIHDLENKYSVILPQSYKIFLRYFGHSLGGAVMKDCDILYSDIFSLTERIRNEVLIEEDPDLPEKAFVFCNRYDEQFMFFNADGLEKEPPIFYYHIDHEDFSRIGNSIFDTIEEEIQLTASLRRYRKQ